MFSARIINHNNTRLLNICDSDLLGKTIISEKLSIKISESYYGEKSIKKEEAEHLLKKCDNINMVGKDIISLSSAQTTTSPSPVSCPLSLSTAD